MKRRNQYLPCQRLVDFQNYIKRYREEDDKKIKEMSNAVEELQTRMKKISSEIRNRDNDIYDMEDDMKELDNRIDVLEKRADRYMVFIIILIILSAGISILR